MAFDEDPREDVQSFPCDCGGNIAQDDDKSWHCDSCDWNQNDDETD